MQTEKNFAALFKKENKKPHTLESGIHVAPGITVAPPPPLLKIFTSEFSFIFTSIKGIAVIFQKFKQQIYPLCLFQTLECTPKYIFFDIDDS